MKKDSFLNGFLSSWFNASKEWILFILIALFTYFISWVAFKGNDLGREYFFEALSLGNYEIFNSTLYSILLSVVYYAKWAFALGLFISVFSMISSALDIFKGDMKRAAFGAYISAFFAMFFVVLMLFISGTLLLLLLALFLITLFIGVIFRVSRGLK